MNALVVLNLGIGSCVSGFPAVTAYLWEGADPHPIKLTGALPASPELATLYRSWKLLYTALSQRLDWSSRINASRINIDEADVTNVSETELQDLCQQLISQMNAWLNSNSFRTIDQPLRTRLTATDEIRILIETDDALLRRLPWHGWHLFDDYPRAEMALSTQSYQRSPLAQKQPSCRSVTILAILGNSQDIDVNHDRFVLSQLSEQATIHFLVEPSLEQLHHRLWQGCDILFFAGHSTSHWEESDPGNPETLPETGFIWVNQRDRLTIAQLKYALKRAISQGLKLAIFNSCDGLGLAQQLADLNIPQVIVMREPVPDVVAHKFLTHFLTAFIQGDSLYTAVRAGREQLQGLEQHYPCASWLPVICQNPAIAPQSWESFQGMPPSAPTSPRHQAASVLPRGTTLRSAVFISIAVTFLVMGGRWLGLLQPAELYAYDRMMALRPGAGLDPRLLIVTVNDADVHQFGKPLSDQTVYELLKKLEYYQPRVIGLDIARDSPQQRGWAHLIRQLQTRDRIVAVCQVGEPNGLPMIAPPPGIPNNRLGYADAFIPDADDTVRRYVLEMDVGTSACETSYSFSFQLVRHFLPSDTHYEYRRGENLVINSVLFEVINQNFGSYQLSHAEALGSQILIDYRSAPIAQTVSLKEIFTAPDTQLRQWIQHRIVLIGYVGKNTKDYHNTPIGKLPGVMVHTQVVGQLLRGIRDRQPTWVSWPPWANTLWLLGWSAIGSLIALYIRPKTQFRLVLGSTVIGLSGISFLLLIQSIWVPFVPAILALIISSSIIVSGQSKTHSLASIREDKTQ